MAGISKNIKLAKKYVLKEDEKIIYSVSVTYETKSLGQDTVKRGMMFATENRIVFFAKRMSGYDSESFKFSNISSIESGKKFLGSTITFFASGNKVTLSNIGEPHYLDFVEYVNDNIGKNDKSSEKKSDDSLEQIKKLKELLDIEAISQEEYDKKKSQLLNL